MSERKISRRKMLGIIGGVAAAAVIGGVSYYYLSGVPQISKTQTSRTTVTGGKLWLVTEKGWYKEEEEAKKWLALAFKKQTGIEIELSSLSQEDVLKKVSSGAMAGNPPDAAFCWTLDWLPEYGWKGWVEDMSEYIDKLKELDVPEWAIEGAHWYDGVEKKRILAYIPYVASNIPIHYWSDILEEIGMPTDPEEIPMKFDEFTNFWKEAQDKLWKKDPSAKGKTYGIGWPSMGGIGSNPGDGYQQLMHILLWHGWVLERDSKGLVKVYRPENVNCLKRIIKWFVDLYNADYMPDGILEWGSPDNNKAFHAKNIISVFNGTMSIPLYWWGQDKTVYYDKTKTLPRFPSETGAPGAAMFQVSGWYVYKAGKVELVKKFLDWFLDPDVINAFLKAQGGRGFPIARAVLESDPFWREGFSTEEKRDPHLPTVYEMLKSDVAMSHMAQWFGHPWNYLDAYPMAAIHKVVRGEMSEDEAAEWALKSWQDYLDKYQNEVKKW